VWVISSFGIVTKSYYMIYGRKRERWNRNRRPSNAEVGAVGAGVADPLEALVLGSFAGVIDSVEEKVDAVRSSAVARRSGWRCRRRWHFPSLAAPLSDWNRVRM
jgi:hypothetical protein